MGIKNIDDLPSLEQLSQAIQRLVKNEMPSEAQDLLQKRIESASSFLSSNIELIELEDRELIKNTRKTLMHFGIFSFMGPVLLNLSIGTMAQFQKFSSRMQWAIMGLMYVPSIYVFYDYYKESSQVLCLYEVNKYYDRIQVYQECKDRSVLNPNYEAEEIY